jgi:hypothetical protein
MDITQTIVSTACANDGALITDAVAWIAGTVGIASVAANFRKRLPAPVARVIDMLALNFVRELERDAQQDAAK